MQGVHTRVLGHRESALAVAPGDQLTCSLTAAQAAALRPNSVASRSPLQLQRPSPVPIPESIQKLVSSRSGRDLGRAGTYLDGDEVAIRRSSCSRAGIRAGGLTPCLSRIFACARSECCTHWAEARLGGKLGCLRIGWCDGEASVRAVHWRGIGKGGGSARTAGRQMQLVGEGAVRTAKGQVGEGCGSTRTPCSSARSAVRKAKAVVSKARAVASAAKAASRAEPTEVVESA